MDVLSCLGNGTMLLLLNTKLPWKDDFSDVLKPLDRRVESNDLVTEEARERLEEERYALLALVDAIEEPTELVFFFFFLLFR